ncbi:hypothetical protein MUG87_18155 [Ectobacillus sp. JY-23]|uniref:hypothetical protein n=1 Tax=Ectobacillus sp. JY-23 TaxID=2933872 RepID=UPI001FF4B9A2|nr:hypothetical protein [Ectobacillus sp. JY-23]UOY92327.1 hypothetical protein MUG87_18155 [Ectobacillus sp. JY-23]
MVEALVEEHQSTLLITAAVLMTDAMQTLASTTVVVMINFILAQIMQVIQVGGWLLSGPTLSLANN